MFHVFATFLIFRQQLEPCNSSIISNNTEIDILIKRIVKCMAYFIYLKMST